MERPGGWGWRRWSWRRRWGASVIAGVSVPDKKEFATAAGADRVLCYGRDGDSYRTFKTEVKQAATELGHSEGVDVVIDMVQGELFEAALMSVIRPLGRICLVGFTAGQKPIRPGLLLIKEAAVIGSLWSGWAGRHPREHQQNVAEIIDFLGNRPGPAACRPGVSAREFSRGVRAVRKQPWAGEHGRQLR